MESEPISIILVKADSKGDRLLFRYPFLIDSGKDKGTQIKRKNPYCIVINEDLHEYKNDKTSNMENGHLVGLSDEILSRLFAVKPALRGKKFELKTNDVRFVGHPSVIHKSYNKDETNILINIVFALRASANHSIVRRYHELSKIFATALIQEENKCGYFTQQMKIMITAHDEFTRAEEESEDDSKSLEDRFSLILDECSLAKDLRRVFDEICLQGFTQFRLNKNREVSFCLPQKIHQLQNGSLLLEPECIDKCFERLRPYYGLLLLVDTKQLLRSLSPDASPGLAQLIRVYTPTKTFRTLSLDAGLGLTEVMKLAKDLIYWGKAMVIYPLSESNVYVISPDAPVHLDSPLVEAFREKFPKHSLIDEISAFSLPVKLMHKLSLITYNENYIQIFIWLLQNRLVIQLHTYTFSVPMKNGKYLPDRHDEDYLANLEQIFTSNILADRISKIEENKDNSPDSGSKNIPDDVDKNSTLGANETLIRTSSFSQKIYSQPQGYSQKDLQLVKTLVRKGYLCGCHHLEDIMYQENLKRSELLFLLDKFRDYFITCETEDPSVSLFYPHFYH